MFSQRSQNSNTLATWCEELTHWKRPWCWERLKAGEGDRGWDGWMASLTRWTWVWASSGSWWWTGKPGVMQSMGLQSWTRLSNWIHWTERSWEQITWLSSVLQQDNCKCLWSCVPKLLQYVRGKCFSQDRPDYFVHRLKAKIDAYLAHTILPNQMHGRLCSLDPTPGPPQQNSLLVQSVRVCCSRETEWGTGVTVLGDPGVNSLHSTGQDKAHTHAHLQEDTDWNFLYFHVKVKV